MTQPRRFTLLDAIVLTATTAVGVYSFRVFLRFGREQIANADESQKMEQLIKETPDPLPPLPRLSPPPPAPKSKNLGPETEAPKSLRPDRATTQREVPHEAT
jgi:hypothetical protein